jgi:hypothetical protein
MGQKWTNETIDQELKNRNRNMIRIDGRKYKNAKLEQYAINELIPILKNKHISVLPYERPSILSQTP